MRGPLIGFIAGAVVVALGLGGYLIVHNRDANRNNTPVATSSRAKAGGITVTGHGITMSFPPGWVNVPTTPSQFQQAVKEFVTEYGHVPAALQAEVNDPSVLSSFAMLVLHPSRTASFEENLNTIVGPLGPTPTEMMAQLESANAVAQFGATDAHYSVTSFGKYQGVLITYAVTVQGITVHGAQSYVNGPANVVVTTVTAMEAATCDADLSRIVATIRFT